MLGVEGMPEEKKEEGEKGVSVKQNEGEEKETIEKDPTQKLEEAAEEEIDEEVEEESPFKNLFKDVPKENVGPLLSRYIEELPEEEREKLPWVEEEARRSEELSQRKVSEEERQRAALTQNAASEQSAQALSTIESHLDEVRSDVLDGKKTGYDANLISDNLEEYANAQAQIRNRGFISTISHTLVSLIETEGDPLTQENLQELLKDQGGTFQDIFKVYVGEYGKRRYEAGLQAGEGTAQSKDGSWRKAELAAIRAQLSQLKNGEEPDSTEGVSQSLESAPLASDASPTEKLSAGIAEYRKGNKRTRKV